MTNPLPVKDEEGAHPVAVVWRETLRDVVNALAEGDWDLSRGIASVAMPSRESAEQMRAYVEDYGEALAPLPEEAWDTSVAQWMRTHWEVLLDLHTLVAGRSDLVLHLRVFEAENGFRFELDSLHVP